MKKKIFAIAIKYVIQYLENLKEEIALDGFQKDDFLKALKNIKL
jgi:hypothetical protein